MQEFTLEQIGMQVTALQNFFDQVTLIDPLAQAEVDPATLQATGHADAVPVLNADGRGWQPILGEDTGFVFYQNIQVENRPFVLAATYFLTADLPANDREANALLRLLGRLSDGDHTAHTRSGDLNITVRGSAVWMDMAPPRWIRELTAAELPELLGIADRVYVIHEGKLAGEFSGEEITQKNIVKSAIGE